MFFVFLVILVLFFLIIVLPIYAAIKSSEAIGLAKTFSGISRQLSERVSRLENVGQSAAIHAPKKATQKSGVESKIQEPSVQQSTLTEQKSASAVAPQTADSREEPSSLPIPEIQFVESIESPKAVEPAVQSVAKVPIKKTAATDFIPVDSSLNPFEEIIDEPDRPVAKLDSTSEQESFELRLGTYWFVRIGVLLLLSGLAFFAYAKREFFFNLSPAARVTGFYLFSLFLGAAGWWIQRMNQYLKNYGQVLLAGGFAGVYFTTYAAHVIPPVFIFPNQTLVIGLLLFWSACLFVYSNRIQSETVAMFATGASYFATYLPFIHAPATDPRIILASNLILASTSVFFLLKNRWVNLSILSLLASYAGMAFCIAKQAVATELTLIVSIAILWGLYTFATFVARNRKIHDIARSTFATVNNFAATTLIGFVVWQSGIITIWQFGLLSGLMLLGCWIGLPYAQSKCRICRNCYLTQGMLLTNFGFVAMNLEGSILGPIIALQAILLLVMTTFKRDQFVEGLCLLVTMVAIGFTFHDLATQQPFSFASSLIVAVLVFAGSAIYANSEHSNASFRPRLTTYTLLSIVTFVVGLLFQFNSLPFANWIPLILVVVPVAFQASHRWHRVTEFTALWALVSILGIGGCVILILQHKWQLNTFLTAALIWTQMHLWQSLGKTISTGDTENTSTNKLGLSAEIGSSIGVVLIVLSACLASGISFAGSIWQFDADSVVWIGPLIALSSVALTAYGKIFNVFWLAMVAQMLLLFSTVEIVRTTGLDPSSNHIGLGLIIVVAPLVQLIFIRSKLARFVHPLLSIDRQNEFVAVHTTLFAIASSAWVYCHVPTTFHFTWMVLLALGLLICHKKFEAKNHPWQAVTAAILALLLYLSELANQQLCWTSLSTLLGIVLIQQLVRRSSGLVHLSKYAHQTIITTCGILLFVSVTIPSGQIHLDEFFHSYTISWTCLGAGFLLLGLLRGERIFRMMGLAVWAFALASLLPAYLGMSTEMKIASTFIMGSVFILFGYFYTRYKDQIRELI